MAEGELGEEVTDKEYVVVQQAVNDSEETITLHYERDTVGAL